MYLTIPKHEEPKARHCCLFCQQKQTKKQTQEIPHPKLGLGVKCFFPHIVAAAWMQDHLRCTNTRSKLCVFSCLCQKCCIATPYKKPPQYYCGRNIADTPQNFYITSPSESVVDILKCGGEVYLRTLLQLCLSSFDCKGQGDDYIYMITSDLRCNRGGFHKGLAY